MNISKLKIIQKLCNTKKRSLVVKLWTNKNIARDWGKLGSNVLSLLQAYHAKKHGAMTKDEVLQQRRLRQCLEMP